MFIQNKAMVDTQVPASPTKVALRENQEENESNNKKTSPGNLP